MVNSERLVRDGRKCFASWECDSAFGKGLHGRWGLETFAGRWSQLELALLVPNKTKRGTAAAITKMRDGLRALVALITYNNGPAFSDYATVSQASDSWANFTRPYHSDGQARASTATA